MPCGGRPWKYPKMAKRLLHELAPTGIQHWIEIDSDGDGFTSVEFTPDEVETHILDDCARMRDLNQNKASNFRLAARVPFGMHTIWRKEWMEKHRDTWTWQTFLAMKINSSDFKNLRTNTAAGRASGMKI